MCCIFTCCGWMIDLIQRLWTFTMSCCISSAVCCVLIIASMSGIALGYNYSLAEYIDLKETNVSIFLKRGIFDDEISDVEWRRAGHLPVKGQLEENNLRTGAPSGESSPIQSGRRLDDSVFETGDQNRYEGSLMKLTAKPPFPSTTPHWITADTDMALIASSYTRDSLDSLKAVQSVIDARKSMANRYAGATTLTPVPTYPFREPEHMYQGGGRRMLPHYDYKGSINPARLAVPDKSIGSRMNWVAPKHPELFKKQLKDYGLESVSLTYPSPIRLNTGPIRPSPTHTPTPGRDSLFLTRDMPFTLFSTAPTEAEVLTLAAEKSAPEEPLRERVVMEDVVPPKRKNRPKTDEDYDYEIKGLPVRKRRSIEFGNKDKVYRKKYIKTNAVKDLQNSLVVHTLDTTDKTNQVQNENRAKTHQHNKQNYIVKKNGTTTTARQVIPQSLNKNLSLSKLKVQAKIVDKPNENKLFAHVRSNLEVIKTFFESIKFTNIFASKDTNIKNNVVTEPSNSLLVSKIISSTSYSTSRQNNLSTKYIIID